MRTALLTIGVFLGCCISSAWFADRGAQIRLTSKGMQYVAKVGVEVLEKEVSGKRIPDQTGSSGSKHWSVTNILINYVRIPQYSFSPKAGMGLSASVSGVATKVNGKIHLSYKKGWFHISTTAYLKADASNVGFRLSAELGRRSDGRPTVYASRSACSANVGSLNLHFSGSKLSFLYNIVAKFLKGRIKKELSKIMCDEAVKAINTRGRSELATFPVKQPIDDDAIIDYSFTSPADFKPSYMDVFIRGEFLSRKNPQHSSLKMTSFETSSDSSKMVYFWLSEYSFNTAGEVYHKSGRLALIVNAKDKWALAKMANIACPTLLFESKISHDIIVPE